MLLNGSFEEDDDKDGKPDHWHYQRLMTVDDQEVSDGKLSALFECDTSGRIAQALQAMAIDGGKIGAVEVELDYKTEATLAGKENFEMPAFVIHFYDENRKGFHGESIGPWLGTSSDWRSTSKSILVPPKAREMIVRIGLNGATGKLWVDGVKMTFKPR